MAKNGTFWYFLAKAVKIGRLGLNVEFVRTQTKITPLSLGFSIFAGLHQSHAVI